jgi:hypothetical protein
LALSPLKGDGGSSSRLQITGDGQNRTFSLLAYVARRLRQIPEIQTKGLARLKAEELLSQPERLEKLAGVLAQF